MSRAIKVFAIVFAVQLNAVADVSPRPAELVLERALPIDGLESAEPSGLGIRNGELFTVSDNHDTFIYKLRIEAERAVLEPAVPVSVPDGARADFEGIAVDDAGDFYLASESQFRILHVSADGKRCAWITPSLKAPGEAAGLFKFRGGYIEGLARIDDAQFILCAERQPRGLLYVGIENTPPLVEGFVLNEPSVQPRGIRFPDFTDLCAFDGALYALERNAEIISTIVRDGKRIDVKPWRSFRETADSPKYRYADRRFGTAEGLAMDAARLYIVLDNNGNAREANAEDRRPMLFVFTMPRP
ncbi:MAG: esterase-like activity of phytase family protein [Candidatus Hydrogenedentes bacterium]|nr:esterase-like activity of phytase family protein [Candidatus Hydrogenedentota bacterium]